MLIPRTVLPPLLVFSLSACGSNASTTLSNQEEELPVNMGGALPSNITLAAAFPSLEFDSSIFLTAVPDSNRLAVVEQGGRVEVFENVDDVAETTTVIDLTDTVLFRGEQGLLGLAFDPDFSNNRYVYLNYSMDGPRRSVISRMFWDESSNQILRETEKVIIEIEQPFSNHNGGMLAFGPDGYLYIGVGDGGSGGDPQGHGQNRSTLLGNLLRLDVHPNDATAPYEIPASNPFVNDGCCRAEIYAYGLRNPYRFSFDRATGALWVPDVGQNAIEEINIVEAGGNYGWNAFEGTQPFNNSQPAPVENIKPPVFEYDHSQGSSITGGYVYRGDELAELNGMYMFADFVSGTVWALDVDDNGNTSAASLGSVPSPTSFGEAANGEIFIVTYNSGIVRIQ